MAFLADNCLDVRCGMVYCLVMMNNTTTCPKCDSLMNDGHKCSLREQRGGDLYRKPLTLGQMYAPLSWSESQMAVVWRYGERYDGTVGWAVKWYNEPCFRSAG